jgi:predicted ATPase
MSDAIQVTVEELRLRNFRAFENARLTLSDLTFLVGRNGAGKSSILDAVDLIRESLTDSLENALDRRGGILKVRRTRSNSEANPRMGVALVLRLILPGGRETRAIYGFELIGHPTSAYYEVRESLQLRPESSSFFNRWGAQFDATTRTGVAPPDGNLVLPLIAGSDSVWGAVNQACRRMFAYDLQPETIAASAPIGKPTNLARDGANAGDVLKALEGTPAHKWVQDHLSALALGISGVRTEPLLGRRVLMFSQDEAGAAKDRDATQVSQGTLRALGVLLALKQQPPPSLVLIDEVENSVHPSALDVLLDAAQVTAATRRIVLTSHSPEVLDHTSATGERIRVLDWAGGISRLFRLNQETIDAVGELETVGSMLRTNSLWPDDAPESFPDDLFTLDEAHA